MRTNSKRCLQNKNAYILVFSLIAISITGCSSDVSDFFEKKKIQIHSKDIIREMQQVPEIPDINNPLPLLYTSPPKIVTFSPSDTKLYYFARNNTPKDLSSLVKTQLGSIVSVNDTTNQLIIKCKNTDEAASVLKFLQEVDVPPIQVRIDCLISELFADSTLDWETSLAIQDLFGNGTGGAKTVGDAISETISLIGGGSDVAFPGAAARDTARSSAGLQIGFESASGSFKAVVDLLASRGYLKIVMNPTLRTVCGKTAKITTMDYVPITKTVTTKDADPYDITEYKPVTDMLEITPHVYADGSIGLRTKATIGSKSTPEGSSQKTIITTREIVMEENRIRPGDSLIVGGIRKSESLGIARGVPFLEDLPLLGVLFSSKDREDKVKEILFILTPSISSPGIEYSTMQARIQQKHEIPEYKKGLMEKIIDPFNTNEYTQHVEHKAIESEAARVSAEQKTTQAKQEAQIISAMAQTEMAAAEKVKAEADKEKAQAETIRAQAEKTQAEAETAKAEAETAQAEAKKAQAEADKAKKGAVKAKAAAEKAKKEAEAERARLADPNNP